MDSSEVHPHAAARSSHSTGLALPPARCSVYLTGKCSGCYDARIFNAKTSPFHALCLSPTFVYQHHWLRFFPEKLSLERRLFSFPLPDRESTLLYCRAPCRSHLPQQSSPDKANSGRSLRAVPGKLSPRSTLPQVATHCCSCRLEIGDPRYTIPGNAGRRCIRARRHLLQRIEMDFDRELLLFRLQAAVGYEDDLACVPHRATDDGTAQQLRF